MQTCCVTHRGAHPHVGVDVLAVDDPAVAGGLLGAELLLEAVVALGQRVERAVLLARAVAVHVHLVLYVALQQSGHLGVRVCKRYNIYDFLFLKRKRELSLRVWYIFFSVENLLVLKFIFCLYSHKS